MKPASASVGKHAKQPHRQPGAPHAEHMLDEAWFRPQIWVMFACAQIALTTLICFSRQRLRHLVELILEWIRIWLLQLDNEMFSLLAMSYVFILSYITDHFGLSIEIGAFGAGIILSSFSHAV